jgi:regulator of RNase E activity RraB
MSGKPRATLRRSSISTMSEEWEFYPCQMAEHQAFIFYDHGIRDDINALPLANALKIRALFHNPTDAGLPKNDEFQQLSALEDVLARRVGELGGTYVGRVTVAGARYFHCLVPFTQDVAERVRRHISAESGYELACVLTPDPEKKTYWEDLFPTPREWQAIQDMKVLDVLKDHGDDPSLTRRIDHWLYFPRPSARDALSTWALESGFMIQHLRDPEDADGDYGIQIYHHARPELQVITATTQLLWDKAEELGGSYDGWETSVEKRSSAGAPDFPSESSRGAG